MAVKLYCGRPREGKTLTALHHIIQFAKKHKRRVVCINVTGLALDKLKEMTGVEWVDLSDVYPEPSLGSPNPNLIPDVYQLKKLGHIQNGDILIIDECQNYWPQRTQGGNIPLFVESLALHGKLGLDIYLITQSATLTDKYVRVHTKEYFYITRPTGQPYCQVQEFDRFLDHNNKFEVKDHEVSKYRLCWGPLPLFSRIMHPLSTCPSVKYVFGLYESAQEHTVVSKTPFKLFMIPILGLSALGMLFLAAWILWSQVSDKKAPSPAPVGQGLGIGSGASVTTLGGGAVSAVPLRSVGSIRIGQYRADLLEVMYSAGDGASPLQIPAADFEALEPGEDRPGYVWRGQSIPAVFFDYADKKKLQGGANVNPFSAD